jgi:hypothetical protein
MYCNSFIRLYFFQYSAFVLHIAIWNIRCSVWTIVHAISSLPAVHNGTHRTIAFSPLQHHAIVFSPLYHRVFTIVSPPFLHCFIAISPSYQRLFTTVQSRFLQSCHRVFTIVSSPFYHGTIAFSPSCYYSKNI